MRFFYLTLLIYSLALASCTNPTRREKQSNGETFVNYEKTRFQSIDTLSYKEKVLNYRKYINSNLEKAILKKKDIFGSSAEGGEVIFYQLKDDTVKVKAIYYGETGKSEYELYLQDKELILVNETIVQYKMSLPATPVEIYKKDSKLFFLKNNKILKLGAVAVKITENEYLEKENLFRDIIRELRNPD